MEDLSNSLFFDQVNIFLYSSFSTVCFVIFMRHVMHCNCC
jgi:hypothetical protein